MGNNSKKRVVLIGCGKAGVLHELDPLRGKPASLIGGLLTFKDDFNLVAAVDFDLERADNVRQFFPNAKIYSDYRTAIAQCKPEVAVIATWTKSHREIFDYCLDHGVKGIVLEKPVAKTLKDARAMLRAWKKKPVPVAVNHERRWEPRYQLIKDLLNERPLGPIKSLTGKVLLGAIPRRYEQMVDDLEGGGTLLHDGTHLIDLLHFFFKRLSVRGVHLKRGRLLDRSTSALLIADNRIPIFIEVGGERHYFEFSVRCDFERGAVKVGNGIFEWYETEKSTLYSGYRDLKPLPFPHHRLKSYSTSGFAGPFFELKKAFESGSIETESSLEEGVKVMGTIDRILRY